MDAFALGRGWRSGVCGGPRRSPSRVETSSLRGRGERRWRRRWRALWRGASWCADSGHGDGGGGGQAWAGGPGPGWDACDAWGAWGHDATRRDAWGHPHAQRVPRAADSTGAAHKPFRGGTRPGGKSRASRAENVRAEQKGPRPVSGVSGVSGRGSRLVPFQPVGRARRRRLVWRLHLSLAFARHSWRARRCAPRESRAVAAHSQAHGQCPSVPNGGGGPERILVNGQTSVTSFHLPPSRARAPEQCLHARVTCHGRLSHVSGLLPRLRSAGPQIGAGAASHRPSVSDTRGLVPFSRGDSLRW